MLASLQGPDHEIVVRSIAGQDEHKLHALVSKEGLRVHVVLGGREIHGAVAPFQGGYRRRRRERGGVLIICGRWYWRGRRLSLQKGVDVQVGVGEEEGEVEALGGEAVADDADFDGRHCFV